ncbi:sensor histidine kinase [Subtercola frigoramans]|uniref:histidine kinase n=1 Tax=Subtercola frigoramans TaxID=120298 RepID=A0ABS2L1V7_9MICO|nr:histidine kinase [Subtercola frigoramans]MBM7471060.1 signal transduction histidine kinase [Subtercola frigoramans]
MNPAGRSSASVAPEPDLKLPGPPGVFRLFFGRHMWIVDWAVVVVFALPAVIYLPIRLSGATGETPSLVVGILAIAGTATVAVALLFRRTHPLVLVAVVAVSFFLVLPSFPGLGQSAPLFALYAAALYASVRAAWVSFGVLILCLAAVSMVAHNGDLGEAIAVSLVFGFLMLVAVLVGINVGNRKRYVEALLDRAAQLARERDQQALLSAVTERARIAREMHDIVAHSLTVMVALADGAGLTVKDDPGRAQEVMQQVAETGRQALADMRVVLGVLADPRLSTGDATLAPQPRHDDLEALVQSYRGAGMVVHFTVSGAPPRDPGLQLTVFRIVQEALTNCLRYAPDPKHVLVELAYGPAELVVSVLDEGQGSAATTEVKTGFPGVTTVIGAGQGLVGMRERVAAYGGSLEAGPTTAGGWRVRATVPVRPSGAPAREHAVV